MQPEILKKIIENYTLPSSTAVAEELHIGLANNYILQSKKDKYFLKQYRHTDEAKVREIHTVKHYFVNGGIPIILPLHTFSDDTITTIDTTFYALFPFVEGIHQEELRVSDKALDSLAKTLATIHHLSVEKPFIIEDHFKPWNVDGFEEKASAILKAIEEKKELSELDQQMREGVHIKRELVRANKKQLSNFSLKNDTLTHGDYHVYNVFFDEQENVKWVFDLEKAEMAPRVYELIRSMELMNLGGDFSASNLQKAKHYVNAYHRYFPLAPEEFAQGMEVRFIKEFHSLWIEGEVFLKNNTRFNRFYDSNFKALLYFRDNLTDFIHKVSPA